MLKPIIDELLSGDYKRFRTTLLALTGGEIPYENIIEYTYNAINKRENDDLKDQIDKKLGELFQEEVTEETSEKWQADFEELTEIIKQLLLPEEITRIKKELALIPQKEKNEFVQDMQKNIAEVISKEMPALSLITGLISPDILGNASSPEEAIKGILQAASEDPNIKDFLLSQGYSLEKISNNKPSNPATNTELQSWNKYGKWILGLGSAVLALGGYIMNEDKFKGVIYGLGTLGLGGVIASAFKPARLLFGIVQDSKMSAGKGWGDDLGKWCVGLGSGLITLLGYYINEDKIKSSVIALGTLGLGGLLASTLSPVRTLCGIPDSLTQITN